MAMQSVTVRVNIIARTPRAVLVWEPDEGVTRDTAVTTWLPLQHVRIFAGVATMPLWLAQREGLLWHP